MTQVSKIVPIWACVSQQGIVGNGSRSIWLLYVENMVDG